MDTGALAPTPADTGQGDVDLRSFDPFGAHIAVAYDYFARARQNEPIFFLEALGAWCVTRYEDIQRIAGDPVVFSSREAFIRPGGLPPAADRLMGFLLDHGPLTLVDPPEHRPVRRIAQEAFGPKVIAGWESRIRELIGRRLDLIADRDRFDLVTEVSESIPLLGVMVAVGYPESELDDLRRWLRAGFSVVVGYPFLTPDELEEQGRIAAPFIDRTYELMAERRAAPKDDLISFLVRGEIHGQPLSDAQIAANAAGLFGAGWETTGNAITNIAHALISNGMWPDLAAGRLPMADVVTEGLRYDTPIMGLFRTATREVEFNGVTIAKGDRLILMFASANHDPAVFQEPETFQVGRARTRPDMAFGNGIHYCVGAPLARLEIAATLEGLAARFPTLRLDSAEPPAYRPLSMFKGPTSLWVRR
ncbi:cytochrome P450 [Frankia sp. CNm7]|uniref:Cytochrome P450 n=1 Tax=Frankia nepalensis TaxID=1836974 RepID=A0A937URI5_9ACTN|nr:cytochrome P450 [Frankia nepalensis]MBL7498015.1 cytochrome P450 [Frankia nepalensis]MBL7509097.1 cytochrome P450 [Frankia nepalensis]MBL7516800.1 cytochrome P450 [Frankia nepalensis]MBL7627796.1 cytochrome P450 [Frankia nepalensis]